MADAPAILPSPIRLERTKFEEHARDDADSWRRTLLVLIIFAMLNAVILVAVWNRFPAGGMAFLAICEALLAGCVLAVAVGRLRHAHRNRHRFGTRTRITWTLRCEDVRHAWHIDGLGPCEGWRIVSVECATLPKRSGERLALPELRVLIGDGERALLSKALDAGDESRRMRVTDKVGLPLQILISHSRPEEASLDEPWEVEISVQGDSNPPEVLMARPLAAAGESGR